MPACCSPTTARRSRRSSRRAETRRAPSAARRCGTAGSAARSSTSTTRPTATSRSRSRRTPTCSSRTTRRASPRARHRPRHAARGNPRLVYCSITAYGDDGAHADRPGSTRWSPPAPATSGRAAAFPAARSRAWRGRARVPRPRGARRLLGGRAPARSALLGRAVGEHGVGLPRHAGDQRRAARARADRSRAARVDVAVPGRARDHAVGVATRRARRHAELPELDQRPARAQGRVPLRRRPVDPPVGPAPRLRHQRGRGRPPAAHGEDDPARATRPRASAWTSTRCSCCTTTSR